MSEERIIDPATGAGGERGPLSEHPTPGAARPPENWTAALDPELLGHVQNVGWDKLPPVEAAAKAAKAHRDAQKFLGVPPEQLARIPRPDASEADIKAFWQKLGAPVDPSGYDLSSVRFADGSEVSDEFAGMLRAAATELNLPAAALPKLAARLAAYFDAAENEETTIAARELAAEKQRLAENWGANFEGNYLVAQRGVSALGLSADFLNAIESVAGYATIMEGLRKIGIASGEARSLQGYNPAGSNGLMSREQAIARIEEMKTDKEFYGRWIKGEAAARREFEDVHKMALGIR